MGRREAAPYCAPYINKTSARYDPATVSPALSFAGGGGRSFGPPLATPTSAGRNIALADHVAGLHDLRDRAGRQRGVGHLVHGLVQIGIELLARLGLEFLDAVLLQHLEQFALGQLHAVEQRLDGRHSAVVAQLGIDRRQRAVHVVGDRQHVAREGRDRRSRARPRPARSVRRRMFSISASVRSSLSL